MGFFDIFKRKKKVEEKPEIKEEELVEIRGYCGSCGGIISIGEGWTKHSGKHYHRKCWKDMARGVF